VSSCVSLPYPFGELTGGFFSYLVFRYFSVGAVNQMVSGGGKLLQVFPDELNPSI
jgi:hypothetical protein